MKEYANLINDTINAINRDKDTDCHQELASLLEITFSAMKINLYMSIGATNASKYFSAMDDILREFSSRCIGVNAALDHLSSLNERICEAENFDPANYTTTLNYIKMMTK